MALSAIESDQLQDAGDIDHRSSAEANDDVRVELRQNIDATAPIPMYGQRPRLGISVRAGIVGRSKFTAVSFADLARLHDLGHLVVQVGPFAPALVPGVLVEPDEPELQFSEIVVRAAACREVEAVGEHVFGDHRSLTRMAIFARQPQQHYRKLAREVGVRVSATRGSGAVLRSVFVFMIMGCPSRESAGVRSPPLEPPRGMFKWRTLSRLIPGASALGAANPPRSLARQSDCAASGSGPS